MSSLYVGPVNVIIGPARPVKTPMLPTYAPEVIKILTVKGAHIQVGCIVESDDDGKPVLVLDTIEIGGQYWEAEDVLDAVFVDQLKQALIDNESEDV